MALRRPWVGDGVELTAGAVLVQVATADAGRLNAHDHLAGLGRRIRAFLDADVARAVEDSREHGTHRNREVGIIATCALGIDVGLSAVRAAVVSSDGRLLGRGRRALAPVLPEASRAEQDARAWRAGVFGAGADAVAEARGTPIDVVCVGALGPAPLLVDADLEPLTPALLFALDTRAEAERLMLEVESHDHALPKLLWWERNEPALTARAACALDATGYLVATLTGVPTMDTITAESYVTADAASPVPVPCPVDPLAVAGWLARRARCPPPFAGRHPGGRRDDRHLRRRGRRGRARARRRVPPAG